MASLWQLRQAPQVCCEDIDSFLVCYCAATGETHILDAFPAEVLRSLQAGPLSSQQLQKRLADFMGEEVDWIDSIEAVLLELQKYQLIDGCLV